MNRVTAAPTLTANVVGQPTDTDKPTSAVVNVLWAVQYAVAPQDGGSGLLLPVGAIIGISVGGAAIIFALVLAWFCIRRHRRRADREKEGAVGSAAQPPAAAAAVPVMTSAKGAQGAPGPLQGHGHDGSGMSTPPAPMRQQQQYDPLPTASPPWKNYDDVVFHQQQQQPQQYHQVPMASPTRQSYGDGGGGVLAPAAPLMQQQQQQQQNDYHHHGRHSSATTWSAGGRPDSEISTVVGMGSPGTVYVPHYQDGVTGQQQQQQHQTGFSPPAGADERTYWQHS